MYIEKYALYNGDRCIGEFAMTADHQDYQITLIDGLKEFVEMPADLYFGYLDGQRVFSGEPVKAWIYDRVVPAGRQNMPSILARYGLSEYTEIDMFLIAQGRSCRDKFNIRRAYDMTQAEIDKVMKDHEGFDFAPLAFWSSELSHRLKTYGPVEFVRLYTEDFDAFRDEEPLEVFLYYCGLIEWVCNKYGVELPQKIADCKDMKFPFTLYSPGSIVDAEYEDYEALCKHRDFPVREFLEHNLLVCEEDIESTV